jgi:hypothetical protein
LFPSPFLCVPAMALWPPVRLGLATSSPIRSLLSVWGHHFSTHPNPFYSPAWPPAVLPPCLAVPPIRFSDLHYHWTMGDVCHFFPSADCLMVLAIMDGA